MRAFIVILPFVAAGIGITGLTLGWLAFSHVEKTDSALRVDPDKLQQDRDTLLGWLGSFASAKDQESDASATLARAKWAHAAVPHGVRINELRFASPWHRWWSDPDFDDLRHFDYFDERWIAVPLRQGHR